MDGLLIKTIILKYILISKIKKKLFNIYFMVIPIV